MIGFLSLFHPTLSFLSDEGKTVNFSYSSGINNPRNLAYHKTS